MKQEQIIKIIPEKEFLDEIPFLYAPFNKYIIKVIQLMLEHIWHQQKMKSTTIANELVYSGWICRLITLDKRVLIKDKQDEIQDWPKTRDFLKNSLESCRTETSLPSTINSCIEYILPVLEHRFKENYHFPKRDFHCWWYTIHDNNTHLAIHLINAYQPDSPFEHLQDFRTTMLQAVESGFASYPDIKIVSCGSWLNRVRKFQQFWPASFLVNQRVINESGGFGPGVWGQYMTVNGGFHEEKAFILRNSGKHPFPLIESYSDIDDVISHLKKLMF